MFIRKFLKHNQVDEVNAKGRFIKVMNCEGIFRIRALSQGRAIIDTDAAAGFDVQTNEPFDFIEITSDIEQKLQLWASEHKLSYDALSTKASRSNSFVVDHFGQSQQVLQYDPSQSSAKISGSGAGFWVGGDGVTKESGIFVPQSNVYEHNSAAPLHVFVDALPDRYFNPEKITKVRAAGAPKQYDDTGAFNANNVFVVDGGNLRGKVTNLDTGLTVDVGYIGAVSVAPYLGYFIQLSPSTNLKIYNQDGTTSNYNNPIDTTNFNGRCGTGYGSAFYQFGQPDTGFDTKIIYFNKGEWVNIQPPVEIVDRGIFQAFTDELDGTIWIVTSLNEVFFTSDGFATVQKIGGLSVDYNKQLSMSFNKSHAMIVGTGICKVIDKQALTYLDLVGVAPTVHGGILLDEEWLIVSFNRIYSSTNQFDTYNEAYVNGRNFEKSIKTIHEYNGNIYLEEQDSEAGVVVVKAELDIDLTKPKEKIRVFKESF